MKINRLLSVALLGTLAVSPFALASGYDALNSVAAYGNIYSITSTGGNTTGGIGVRGSYFQNNVLASANYHHDFGSPIKDGSTSGSVNSFNLKLGYLFPVGGNLSFGPYLGYQYLNLSAANSTVSANSTINNFGGGAYAAYRCGPMTFTGNIGYFKGLSEKTTGTDNGQSASVSGNAANLLQMGLQADYQISGPWYASVGFKYNEFLRTNGGKGTNILQGDVGLGYSF